MTTENFISEVFSAYASIITMGLPVAFFIGACNIAFNIICNAFFSGTLKIGGKS